MWVCVCIILGVFYGQHTLEPHSLMIFNLKKYVKVPLKRLGEVSVTFCAQNFTAYETYTSDAK